MKARLRTTCASRALCLLTLFAGGAGAEEPVEPAPRANQDVWCIETTACESDDDCPEAAACVMGTHRMCPEDADLGCREEESDSECAERTRALCEDVEVLACEPRFPAACESSSDCDDGYTCELDSCRLLDDACESQADCPEFYQCVAMDGGYCESGDNCVNQQLQVELCIPPPFCGEPDVASSSAVKDNGCSLSAPASGGRRGSTLLTLLGGLLTLGRRRRRPRH